MWYYAQNDQYVGPFPFEEIVNLIYEGIITSNSAVCKEGEDPCFAGDHPELQRYFSNTASNSYAVRERKPKRLLLFYSIIGGLLVVLILAIHGITVLAGGKKDNSFKDMLASAFQNANDKLQKAKGQLQKAIDQSYEELEELGELDDFPEDQTDTDEQADAEDQSDIDDQADTDEQTNIDDQSDIEDQTDAEDQSDIDDQADTEDENRLANEQNENKRLEEEEELENNELTDISDETEIVDDVPIQQDPIFDEEQPSELETAPVEEDNPIFNQSDNKTQEETVVNKKSSDVIIPTEPKSKHKEERKAGDTLVKEIDNVKFVFKWIPSGVFTMGSPEDEKGRNPNERQYKVKISNGFWMMDSEVTQEQWATVTGKSSSIRPSSRLPIEDVSWYDCNNFCKKAAAAGLPLELPTEAQWEYACRADTNGSFAGDFEEMTWYFDNSNRHAQDIRSTEPNQWGIYDMHGNVAEWVADWCGVYPNKPTKDPKGPDKGSKKMTRGGSWGSPKNYCRSALRGGLEPDKHTLGLGFRCVINKELDEKGK